jgi:hypothetical protein
MPIPAEACDQLSLRFEVLMPHLIAANLNPKVIQARLGRATITETMDTYGHLFPDAEDLGRGAIDAIFAMAPTEQERNQETW